MHTHPSRRSLLAGLGALPLAAQHKPDSYGGSSSRRFDATGFFRLEKADRWWFVTPAGNAFLSWGVNHAQANFLKQSYNRGHW